MMFSVKLCVLFSAFSVVKGTLTPDGSVLLDCGNKETFTCNVTGLAAQWTISGLSGISVTRDNGLGVANNPRITTTDTSGATTSSTITITGFTTADNEGTIQCINLDDSSVQGMAIISVATPLCPTNVNSELNDECTSVNITWEQLNTPPVTSTTVTYCPTPSPNCGNSINCTNPCTIDGLTSTEDHNFTVIPNNNCGYATGCEMVTPVRGIPMCPGNVNTSWRDNIAADVTWQQPTNIPLVTNTTVIYCLSSSPNCRSSTTCISSPCTVSGLDSCQDYWLTVIPNNNCGSPTGCEMFTLSGGTPGVKVEILQNTGQPSSATITWQQCGSFPQVSSITVTYCPASSSNCGNSMNCTTSPCEISELDHDTRYRITVTPMSICGSGMEVIKMLDPVGLSGSWYSVPVGITFAVTFTVTSVVSSSVTAVVMYFVCIRNKRSGVVKDTGTDGDIYEDPERSDDIIMDSSPAYQTVASVCVQ